jgi:nitroimidazol reductase NimA-like FMN-containing flavoprotein (pyridoxamine 5'-phosphate oxidase superfamily)
MKKAAKKLLETGEYGFLAMSGGADGAYGIPISYVWDGAGSIYLHCAPEGRKLACLESDNRVSFCVVGETKVISEKFTTAYESIILNCIANRGLFDDEKRATLRLLTEKYCPNDLETGLKYIEKSLARTEIIRLEILNWSGKSKR